RSAVIQVAVLCRSFLLGERQVIAQTDVQCEFIIHLEVILNIPRVVFPKHRKVATIRKGTALSRPEQEGRPIGALCARNSWIRCRQGREGDTSKAIIAIDTAIDPGKVVEAEFDCLLPLDPRDLFLEVAGPRSRIRVHVSPKSYVGGNVSGGLAGSIWLRHT